jgi:hypothetical protein
VEALLPALPVVLVLPLLVPELPEVECPADAEEAVFVGVDDFEATAGLAGAGAFGVGLPGPVA